MSDLHVGSRAGCTLSGDRCRRGVSLATCLFDYFLASRHRQTGGGIKDEGCDPSVCAGFGVVTVDYSDCGNMPTEQPALQRCSFVSVGGCFREEFALCSSMTPIV